MSQTGWDAPCSGAVGFLPVRSQQVRHRRGKSWQTAQSTPAYQKSEIFKHKELNSPSSQYRPGSILCLAGQGWVSPTGFPCFGNGFCVSHHSNITLWGIPDAAPPNPKSKVILLINIITLLRKH